MLHCRVLGGMQECLQVVELSVHVWILYCMSLTIACQELLIQPVKLYT